MWNTGGGNIRETIKKAEKVLMEKVKEEWKNELRMQSRLNTYCVFKSDFGVENYVTINLPRYIRSFIAKLRSSTLPIRIETGRFERLSREERICKFCDNQDIESEYHYMFECLLYNDLRNDLFAYIKNFYPNFEYIGDCEQWKILMTDKAIVPRTGKFIKLAFERRNNVTYRC